MRKENEWRGIHVSSSVTNWYIHTPLSQRSSEFRLLIATVFCTTRKSSDRTLAKVSSVCDFGQPTVRAFYGVYSAVSKPADVLMYHFAYAGPRGLYAART